MTVTEKKQLIQHWKVESQKMLHQVEKSYLKTLYAMHLCENIHCKICKKSKDMLKLTIKISFSHTNIYIDICIYVIDIHLMS